MSNNIFGSTVLFCSALATLSPGAASLVDAVTSYSISGLGLPSGGGASYASAINASGQVAGYSVPSGGYTHAFIYENGTMNNLGTLGGGASYYANGINDSGQVAGQSKSGGTNQALVWTGSGAPQSLGTLGGSNSWADGINNSGQVVGAAETNNINGFFYAFLWTSGSGMQNLGSLGGSGGGSYATAINGSGEVVGGAAPLGTSPYPHAFLWTSSGGMQDLGTLGGDSSYANSINKSGQIVGDSITTGGTKDHAFLWTKGATNGPVGNPQMQDLGTLGGDGSLALGVNDSGEIIGTAAVTNNAGYHAFLWTSNGGMQDLNNLIPVGTGWTLARATGINGNGDIVGYGTNPSGEAEGFLLTPVPEPAALAIFALGLAGLGLCRRKNAKRKVAA